MRPPRRSRWPGRRPPEPPGFPCSRAVLRAVAPGWVHYGCCRAAAGGCPVIVVPHPRISRVRDHDHENPRMWKDRSRVLRHISARSGAAGAPIAAVYLSRSPATCTHRPRGGRRPPAHPRHPHTRATRHPHSAPPGGKPARPPPARGGRPGRSAVPLGLAGHRAATASHLMSRPPVMAPVRPPAHRRGPTHPAAAARRHGEPAAAAAAGRFTERGERPPADLQPGPARYARVMPAARTAAYSCGPAPQPRTPRAR